LSNKAYAVFMAGGAGTRFWPLSRRRTPKQVLAINGPNSMLQESVNRLDGLIPLEQTFIVTNRQQFKVMQPQLPRLRDANFILEPVPRNTAACIGLAAIHIQRFDPDGIMVVLPADHLIRDVHSFQEKVKTAIEVVEKFDALVTIGIPPTRPETGYGYIQFEDSSRDLPETVYRVKNFAEKPNRETAKLFLESGDFYWNSGIFIWRVEKILEEMSEYLPEIYDQLQIIGDALGSDEYQHIISSYYKRIKSISIDYGIMEITESPIYMVEGDFGWSDVGSWDELFRISPKGVDGNVELGEAVIIDSHNNYLYSPGRLTAVIGLEKFLVVNTANATLICPLDRAQDVKEIVEKLQKDEKTRYL
jgi:mannose-1-phosphate guanylyltransferase